MKIHEINIYQEFDAPVDKVYADFSNHANLGKIMGIKMERIADSPEPGNPNGVGSVRLITAGPISFEETVVKAEKPNLLEYRISRGTPLKHHYGIMQFKSLPGGRSALYYNITLGANIPLLGGLVKKALQNGITGSVAKYARGLKKA